MSGERPPPSSGGGAGGVNLFPDGVLEQAAEQGTPVAQPDSPVATTGAQQVTVPGAVAAHVVTLPGPLDFPPANAAEAAANRATLLGPTYEALTVPPGDPGNFEDHVTADAALSLLPAAILGSLARPAVDYIYQFIDRIPAPIRGPFERAFGLLVDNAMALAGAAADPLLGQSVARFFPGGKNLPASAQLDVQAYSQTWSSCAQTAIATILKAAGEPVALGDLQTQMPGFDGTTGPGPDEEFRRRGFTCINGPGNLDKLKAFVASGYPVMVSVGWEHGGGHFAVATGYDEASATLTLANWDAQGGTERVPYDRFAADWSRHKNLMTAVVPTRDPRLDALAKAGVLSRPATIHEGFSLADFWVTAEGHVFVAGAYRYVGANTDVSVKLTFDSSEHSLERQLGGSLAIKQQVATGWSLGVVVEKMSLRGKDDDWHSFTTAPVSLYGALEGPGFELRAGGERGAFQASLAADLGTLVAGLGVRVNVGVDADGSWRVTGTIAGTF